MLADRIFHRISPAEISAGVARLGLRRGEAVLALISLRSLGFVKGGAAGAVQGLESAVGKDGSILMPSFPVLDPLPAPPAEGIFDEAGTPSAAGRVSEEFRRRPGTHRSLHPLGSMAALGPLAAGWLEGHEKQPTPFAPGCPIDRFAASGGRILLVGTHVGPVLPYLQERAGYPILYEPRSKEVTVRARTGESRRVATRLFRGPSCQVVILQGERPETRDYALMRDYALIFPSGREDRLRKGGYLRHNLGRLVGRLERLKQRGLVRTGRIGLADAAIIEAGPFCDLLAKDLEWEVARFKDEYDPKLLEALALA